MLDVVISKNRIPALRRCFLLRSPSAACFARVQVRRSDGQWPRTLTAGYVYYRYIFEADPNTSTAWTSGGVNGMQIGPEVVT